MKIQINKSIPGFKTGSVIDEKSDSKGTPLDIFWRRRLKDAVLDNCCEIVKPVQKKAAVFETKESKGDE